MLQFIQFSKQTLSRLSKELKISEQLNNLRLYKIVSTLLMLHGGKSVRTITGVLNIGLRTGYDWIKKFIVHGFSWLTGHHYRGRGRRSKLTKEQKAKLYDIIVKGPDAYGFDSGIWNSAMIVVVIEKEFNESYNPRYVSKLLKQIGLSYQKAKFVSDKLDDKDHQKKRTTWLKTTWPEILEKAELEEGVILFDDEVSFAQWGSLARTWAPRGKQPTVRTCGKRKGLKMFGAIEFRNGDFHYMECEGKFNGEKYLEFLNSLLEQYSQPIILIQDGAPYHRSRLVKEFAERMQAQGRMWIYELPSYSPDFNPIEKLWKNTKRDSTHCKYFPTFDDLRQSVQKTFKKYFEDASKVICVMNKLRIMAGIS